MSGAWAAGPAKDKGTWLDMRASELIGKHVVNPEGKSLGKVEDLVVDLKGGVIPHVVLSFRGDKLFVYPVNAFVRDEYRDRIVVSVERKQLSESAGFDRANWPFQPPLVRGVIVAQDGRKGDEPKLTVSPRSLTFGKSE